MKNTITYLKSFFKDKDVASVTPSSKFCIRNVCDHIDFSKDMLLVEYGAGTGVFADFLLEHMTADSRLLLIETNEAFVKELNKIADPRVEVHHESVEHIRNILGEERQGRVDYIISGIPFSFLDEESKYSLLEDSIEILREGGKFLAYQTSGHLKKPLREVFGNVNTNMEFLNVPPMMIYEAVKTLSQ